ncbi:MAG: MarR family transcriptional regulator [Acidimicrobiia bacterium]
MTQSVQLARVGEDFQNEFPGADALASECFVNVVRVGDLLQSELSRRLRHEAGLSTRALMLLATVDGLGGRATPSQIAAHVPISTAAITSLVDTNERKGLVERRPHPDDRRKVQVVLTTQGQALLDRILPGAHILESEIISALTGDERANLLRILQKLQNSVEQVSQRAPSLPEASPRNKQRR